jgi:hypothetical protein
MRTTPTVPCQESLAVAMGNVVFILMSCLVCRGRYNEFVLVMISYKCQNRARSGHRLCTR